MHLSTTLLGKAMYIQSFILFIHLLCVLRINLSNFLKENKEECYIAIHFRAIFVVELNCEPYFPSWLYDERDCIIKLGKILQVKAVNSLRTSAGLTFWCSCSRGALLLTAHWTLWSLWSQYDQRELPLGFQVANQGLGKALQSALGICRGLDGSLFSNPKASIRRRISVRKTWS